MAATERLDFWDGILAVWNSGGSISRWSRLVLLVRRAAHQPLELFHAGSLAIDAAPAGLLCIADWPECICKAEHVVCWRIWQLRASRQLDALADVLGISAR